MSLATGQRAKDFISNSSPTAATRAVSPYSHPLVQPLTLGELVSYEIYNRAAENEQPDWVTLFTYQGGKAIMSVVPTSNAYKYVTQEF